MEIAWFVYMKYSSLRNTDKSFLNPQRNVSSSLYFEKNREENITALRSL